MHESCSPALNVPQQAALSEQAACVRHQLACEELSAISAGCKLVALLLSSSSIALRHPRPQTCSQRDRYWRILASCAVCGAHQIKLSTGMLALLTSLQGSDTDGLQYSGWLIGH